ncbi:MAG: hypothetical protein GY869_12095, partial [Planctomycetes bacterium]|nr:hypothetical protein [Planctomycetota bacterium]
DSSFTIADTVVITWDVPAAPAGSQLHFLVEIDTVPDFSTAFFSQSSTIDTSGFSPDSLPVASDTDSVSFNIPPALVSDYDTYYWRVTAFADPLTSDPSEVWQFTRHGLPIAEMLALLPEYSGQDAIGFGGSGYDTDEDGAGITSYLWTLTNDDTSYVLSNLAVFDHQAGDIGPGDHVIAFQVQDNEGAWSASVIDTLTIVSTETYIERAIICAGYKSLDDPLWILYTNDVANFVYNMLLEDRLLDEENIFYLNPVTDQSGVDATSTLANLEYAITDWAANGPMAAEPLLIYLTGHGYQDGFMVNGYSEIIAADTLDQWITDLQAVTGNDNVVMIGDFCYSGSFLDNMAELNIRIDDTRIFISSTTDTTVARFSDGLS